MTNSKSLSQVIKIPAFRGSLPTRPLYLYLPPGYKDDLNRAFPVLYMHDGQNLFDDYIADCFAGFSWQAAQTADQLIQNGEIQPFIIVGIANGGVNRTKEYLPEFATLYKKSGLVLNPPLQGAADKTMRFYIDEIDPYIRNHYRILPGREHTATCGSSMGGLMSQYIAWNRPDFAQHHGIISPAYWLTQNEAGENMMLHQIWQTPKPDVRVWLDSGVEDTVGNGDDGMYLTMEMRDGLRSLGFEDGTDFSYYLDKSGIHHETSWARRLPEIYKFLFPA